MIMYKLFLNIVESISRNIGYIYVPFNNRKIKARHYRYMEKRLMVGDIILCKSNGYLSNLFIGKYTHVGIYAAHDTVVEATPKGGVLKTDLIDFSLKRDKVLILRPNFLTEPVERIEIQDRLYEQVGKDYDFSFQADIKDFYCSELALYAYKNPKLKFKDRYGSLTFIPDDFIDYIGTEFRVIYDSQKQK